MRQVCLISEPFIDRIGGAESHAQAFVEVFDRDSEYALSAIFVPRIPHYDGYVRCQKQDTRDLPYHGKIAPVLSRYPSGDARVILSRVDPAETMFFINATVWLPLAAALRRRAPGARIVVRSGGNDLRAGWASLDAPGSPYTRLRRGLQGRLFRLLLEKKEVLRDCVRERSALIQIVNTCVDLLIVNSEYSLREYSKLQVEPAKLSKVSGGVDCAGFYPTSRARENEVVVLTAARMVSFKGLELSLRAFERAARQTGRGKYSIAGDGPERERLESLALELGIRHSVEFLGVLPLHSMPEVYRNADIYLGLPIESGQRRGNLTYVETETMGRSFCEAAASGLPAIGSLVGGVGEIVLDGRTGVLVPEGDCEGASVQLTRMIIDEGERQSLGRAARVHAERNLDWGVVFENYKRLFRRLEQGA